MIAWFMAALLAVEVYAWGRVAVSAAGSVPMASVAVPLLAVAMYAALRLILVVSSFALARLLRDEPWPPLSPLGWARCIGTEWLAVLHHHALALPFHRLLPGPRGVSRAGATAGTPVVFLHGLWNNAGVWRPLIARLARRGRGSLYAITYGPPWRGIEEFAEQLAHEVVRICERCGTERIVIVGHSMGGLVARAYVRRHGPARVARLVTLGTPHRGSEVAFLAAGRCGRQLLPTSEWFAGWMGAVPTRVPLVSIYSVHDNLVSPQTSPELPGAELRPVAGIGHNAMHYSSLIHALVEREVDRDD